MKATGLAWLDAWLLGFKEEATESRWKRAEKYYRDGNVLQNVIYGTQMQAVVQGGGYRDYRVHLSLPKRRPDFQAEIRSHLFSTPQDWSLLLKGFMPEGILRIYERLQDFDSDASGAMLNCNCPDGEPFCKHVLAVIFWQVERIATDPLLMLRLHGLDVKGLTSQFEALSDGPLQLRPDQYTPLSVELIRPKRPPVFALWRDLWALHPGQEQRFLDLYSETEEYGDLLGSRLAKP